jgi:hypothetical protein
MDLIGSLMKSRNLVFVEEAVQVFLVVLSTLSCPKSPMAVPLIWSLTVTNLSLAHAKIEKF